MVNTREKCNALGFSVEEIRAFELAFHVEKTT